MAMVIANNSAAQLTLGQLNKNISQLNNNLKRISTGRKINHAGDDAAGFAISEKMLTRIRSLEQDERNVQNGSSLVKVAAGGIDSIVDELRNLKELSLNAANDTNTDLDRATLQREFNQRRANIDSIAMETNYNGKILLDGTYSKRSIDIITTTVIPGTEPEPGDSWLKPTDPDNVGPDTDSAPVHSGVVEPTGDPITISDRDVITKSGVYAISSITGSRARITIAEGVQDVKFISANPSGEALSNVHITVMGDNANIWIEDLTILNKDNTSFLTFQGGNNHLNFKGTNTLNFSQPTTENMGSNLGAYADIHVGGGLTLEGGTDGSGSLIFNHNTWSSGAMIGSNGSDVTGSGDNISSPITINSGSYTCNVTQVRAGAFIGSGCNSGIGDITINGGTFVDNSRHDVTIGSGSSGNAPSYCGNITVKNATITALGKDYDPVIGNGYKDGTCGNIYVSNSKIHIENNKGAGIGSSYEGKWTSNITVENTELIVKSKTGAGIGTGENGQVGNITIKNCDLTQVISEQGEYVGRGLNGICGIVKINEVEIPADDPGNQPGGGGVPGVYDTIVTSVETHTVYNPLVIHDGTKANQAINIYINDMRTTALKGQITDSEGNFVNPEDLDRLRNLSGDTAAYQEYVQVLQEADGKTLDDISITTQHGATVSLRVIDGALEYALGEATTMGAYLSRLEHTASNIVTANENTVASESTLSDADMAKEMSQYTKANVLLQASQSMLAQANQTSASALGLLQ